MGDPVNRRMGESGNLPHSCVNSVTDDPLLRAIDHAHKLAEYVFVRVIDCREFRVTDVALTKGKLDVHLRFRGLAFGVA
jgi:hypothetical protein